MFLVLDRKREHIWTYDVNPVIMLVYLRYYNRMWLTHLFLWLWQHGKFFWSTTSVPDFATVVFNTSTGTITIVIFHLPPDFFELCDWRIRRQLAWLLCTARTIYKLHFINFIKSTRLLSSSTRQRWTDMFRPYPTQRSYQSVHCILSMHLLSYISNRIFCCNLRCSGVPSRCSAFTLFRWLVPAITSLTTASTSAGRCDVPDHRLVLNLYNV